MGGGFGDGTATAARIVGEFRYTAYGELLTASSHAPHPDPRLGHKGLFLDRLDTGVVDPLTGAEIARHVLVAKHMYFMVNRSYDPQLGRFLQRDPNATGLPLIAEAIYAGSALGGGVNAFGLDSHIGDGVDVYGYLTGNPWMNSDPLGLYSDEFSIVDDYLAEDAGSKAAFIDFLVAGFDSAFQIALQIAQFNPALNVLISSGKLASGRYSIEEIVRDAAIGFVGGKVLTHAVGAFNKYKAGRSFKGTRKRDTKRCTWRFRDV